MIKLSYDDFKEINRFALSVTPSEKSYVKSKEALESVVALPYQTAFGVEVHKTDFDKISYTYFLLVKKHCFGNGNKRTAWLYLTQTLKDLGYLVHPTLNPIKFSVWVAELPYSDSSLQLVRQELSKFIVKV